MPKLSLIRNACPSLQPSGDKCTFSLRSGPTGRNGISGSHLSHGHPRTARHGPRRKGDARFLYYLFSVFYVNPFKERRPRGHTARLRAKADAKVAQKRRTAKKTGDFFGPEGESFRKNRQNGGREGNGAPCHMGPTRDGPPARDGGRSGARRAHTARNIGKCEKGLHGARGHAGRKGGGNGKAPQRGPAGDAKGPNSESRKGRMEDPQGHSRTAGKTRRARKGKEKEKGKAHTRLPPRTAKVRGKKAECKRGKKKQDKENGRERRAENPGRKHGQKAQGDGKGKACQIFRRDTWQAGKRKGIFYIRIIHRPHQYRIHLHRHHPYDKDYNLPAGRISRRGHTPMLDRHIPFSYI